MFAKVELTDEIIKFIKNSETHNESFNEIKELIFTSDMLNLKYSVIEQMKIKIQFQEMKNNTFYKILHNKELNYIEGMLFERLVTKYNGLELMSIEEHLKLIKECCEDIPPKKKLNIIERIKQLWIIRKKH